MFIFLSYKSCFCVKILIMFVGWDNLKKNEWRMMEKWFKMKRPQVNSWKHEEIDGKEEQRSVTAVTSEK